MKQTGSLELAAQSVFCSQGDPTAPAPGAQLLRSFWQLLGSSQSTKPSSSLSRRSVQSISPGGVTCLQAMQSKPLLGSHSSWPATTPSSHTGTGGVALEEGASLDEESGTALLEDAAALEEGASADEGASSLLEGDSPLELLDSVSALDGGVSSLDDCGGWAELLDAGSGATAASGVSTSGGVHEAKTAANDNSVIRLTKRIEVPPERFSASYSGL